MPETAGETPSFEPTKKQSLKKGARNIGHALGRKKVPLIAVGALAACVGGMMVVGLNTEKTGEAGKNDISASYAAILKDPKVQALTSPGNLRSLIPAGANSGMAGVNNAEGTAPSIVARNRVVEGINLTQTYLKDSSAGNWENLIGFLSTDGPVTNEQKLNFLGQRHALQEAGCLSGGHLVQALCDRNDVQGLPKYPGFKNLDDKTKQEYIQKYNTFADQNPSLPNDPLQPRNIDKSPGRQQQARAFQAANAKRSNKEFRSTRRSMG